MDLCPLPLGTVNPPFYPFTNDPVVPHDCPSGSNVTKYLVAPSGMVMFYCSNTRTWRDNGGQHVYVEPTGDSLRYLGYDNLALNSQPMRVVDLATSTGPVVSGLPATPILGMRAVPPDKFRAIVTDSATPTQELWEIARSGATQRLGQYAKATDGSVLSQTILDKTGALFSLLFLAARRKASSGAISKGASIWCSTRRRIGFCRQRVG